MENRQDTIKGLRDIGWSWGAIGTYFGLSKSRVHQIGSGYDTKNVKGYKKDVFNRDNWTCQICGKEGKVIHHIDGDDRNNEMGNLVTLCYNCHSYIHIKKHKKCSFCGKEIMAGRKYCSKECRLKATDEKWRRVCSFCGKSFIVSKASRFNYYRDNKKKDRKSFCSRECYFCYIKKGYHKIKFDN